MANTTVGVGLEVQGSAAFFSAFQNADKAVASFGTQAAATGKQVDTLAQAAARTATIDALTAKLATQQKELTTLQKELTAAGTAYTNASAKAAQSTAAIDALTSKLAAQQKEFGILQQELAATITKYGESSTQAQRKALALDKLTTSIAATERNLKTEQAALQAESQTAQQAAKTTETLNASITAIEKNIKDEQTALQSETQAAAQSAQATKDVGQAAKAAVPPIAQMGKTAQEAGGGFSAFGEIAIGALRKVGELAVQAAAMGARAIGAFVTDAVSQAGDFESGLLRFGSVVGSSINEAGGSVESFSALFLKLGADTQYSAAQAEEAAINLAKGGITPAQIAGGALADTLTLASAGELDLATAADITAKQLGVWANTGTTSADVANLLAQSANASVVSVEQLALGMANVGGVAKLAGASFQDTVTALGAVSAGFSSAADAGTSMKAFLQKLQPTTKPAIAAMQELGLETANGASKFYDAQGNFVGFSQAAELLKTSLTGLTAAQQQQALTTIFGADGIRVAALLAEKGAAGFDAFAASMGATGSAAEQATAKNQGFNFALEALSGSIDTLKIVIGTALLPILTSFLTDVLTPGINTLMTFSSAVTGSSDAMASLSPTLQGVAVTLQYLGQVFGEAMASFQTDGPAAAISTFAAGLDALVPGAAAATQAVLSFAAAIPGIAATVAGAATALAGPWIAAFSSIAPAVQTALGSISSIVTSVITTIQGTSTAQLSSMQASFMTAWAAIATTSGQYWNAILGIINPILAQIAAFVATNGADIRNTFVQTWQQVAGIITSAMQLVQATIIPVLQTIGAYIASHGSEIQAIFSATWNIIKTVVTSGLSVIQSIITGTLAVIRGDWQGAWNELLNIGKTVTTAISDVVGSLGVFLVAQFALATNNSIATLMKAVGGFTKAGEAIIQGVIAGVKGMAGALFGAVGEVVNGAIAAARNALSAHSPSQRAADEIGLPFSQGIAQGVLTGAAVVGAAVTGIASGMLKTTVAITAGIQGAATAGGTIIAGFAKKVDEAADAGKHISAGLASGIQAGAGAAISAAIGVANSVTTAMQDALKIGSPSREAAEKIGTPFVLGIVQGIEDSTAQLQAAARKLSKNLVKEMEGVAAEVTKAFTEMFKTGLEGDISIGHQNIQNLDMLAGLAPDKSEMERTQKELTDVAGDISKAQQDVYLAGVNKNYAAQSTAQNKLNSLLIQQQTLQKQLSGQQQQAATQLDLQAKARAELAGAEERAMELHKTDAAAANKLFALESKQIAERYQLQQDLAAAQAEHDTAAVNRLQQQISLLATTQQQEKQLLDLTSAEQNPLTATLDKLKEIQASLVKEVERDQFMADVQKNPNQKRERQKEADTSKALLANITALIGTTTITPPAGPQQAAQANNNNSTTNQYYYSPTYGAAPRNPALDFAVMQSLNP